MCEGLLRETKSKTPVPNGGTERHQF